MQLWAAKFMVAAARAMREEKNLVAQATKGLSAKGEAAQSRRSQDKWLLREKAAERRGCSLKKQLNHPVIHPPIHPSIGSAIH